MAELKRLSKAGNGKARHSHIGYLRDDGSGISSEDKEHAHQIGFQDTMSLADEFTTPEMMAELQAKHGWQVQVVNNHTHNIEDYEIKDTEDTQKESELVNEVIEDYLKDKKREEASIVSGRESDEFYSHRQWNETLKRQLISEKRAAHTVNFIEPAIDVLSGYQRQNRTEIRYLPMENGDSRTADILNIVVKNITEKCNYQREKTKVFEDTAIAGRGLFDIYEDFDKNINGEIIIDKYNWDETFFAPHNKEDLSDCDRLEKTKWITPDKIKGMYPDKYDKLTPETKEKPVKNTPSEDWDKRMNEEDFYDGKNYRLIEREKKVYKRNYILVNAEDDFVFNASGWTEADINAVKTIGGFRKIPRTTYKMQVTKVVSRVLLEDEIKDEQDFSIVPVYAKFRNNEFWSKIEGVKDLSRLINKAYSQFSDIINKVANYGWFYDDETFYDKKDRMKFEATAASPGFVQRLKDTKRPPEKVEGVKFPQEIIEAIAMFSTSLRQILNINLDFQGMNQQQQSGVALRQKIVQQLLGSDFLFDNMSFAEKKIGQMLLKKIQKLYTPERIMRLVNNERTKNPEMEIGGKPLIDNKNPDPMTGEVPDGYTPEEIMELLKTVDLSEHDVIVSESPSSPSALMGNFLMLLELAGKGIQIPPQAIMEFAPLPNKEKILRMIREQMDAQQAMEQQKFDTEIKKTLIAKEAGAEPMLQPQ